MRLRRLLTLLLSLVVLVLAGCAGASDSSGSGDGYIGGIKKITTVEPGQRQTAPILEGVGLDGEEISTADWAGDVIVVNLWGSWCPPCRKEAPVLKAISEELADENVRFVGLLTKDKPAAAAAFNAKAGITYPSIVDDDGTQQLAFADSLPSQAIPTTWVIDSKGKVAVRIIDDELTETTLRDAIAWVKKSTV